jgi:hypothetical protein
MRPLHDLSWDEFCGPSPFTEATANVNDPVTDLIAAWEGNHSWKQWKQPPLLIPIADYELWADPTKHGHHAEILLTTGDHVMGLYEYAPDPQTPSAVTDMLGILPAHCGHCLGRELVIAAYRVAPWQNVRRKFTQPGFRTFAQAYELALDHAVREGHLTATTAADKRAKLPAVRPRSSGRPCPGLA